MVKYWKTSSEVSLCEVSVKKPEKNSPQKKVYTLDYNETMGSEVKPP